MREVIEFLAAHDAATAGPDATIGQNDERRRDYRVALNRLRHVAETIGPGERASWQWRGCRLEMDETLPKGEIRLMSEDGRVVGRIIDVKTR